MVSIPTRTVWRRQSAVNIVRCENTAGFCSSVHSHYQLEWLHVKYLLNIFAANCLSLTGWCRTLEYIDQLLGRA